MKETGGYLYKGHYKNLDTGNVVSYYQIDWSCPDCHEEQHPVVKFGNGTHVLTCWNCKTKRRIIVIDKEGVANGRPD